MNTDSANDVDRTRASDENKGFFKTNLGLIIALGLSIVAAFIFMSIFIVYQQKHAGILKNITDINESIRNEAGKIMKINQNVEKMTILGRELFDVSNPKIENGNIQRSVYERQMKYTPGFEKERDTTFKVMQFNMLSDARSGLYEDPLRDGNKRFDEAMKPANQHYLYFRYRLPLIISEIESNKIDIVALQGNEHKEEVEQALNLKNRDIYRDTWKCAHKDIDSKIIDNMKYKPKKIKNDGNTICWNTEKFEKKDVFAQTYEGYQQSNNPFNLEEKDLKGNEEVFIYVKLQQITTGRNVIVFTTELYRDKSFGGEQIRLAQTKELMKKMQEVKKNNTNAAIVFAADLNAFPKAEIVNGVQPKKQSIIGAPNITGIWFCDYTPPDNGKVEKDAEVIIKEDEKNNLTMTISGRGPYDIVENETNFKAMIDTEIVVFKKIPFPLTNNWSDVSSSKEVLKTCKKKKEDVDFQFELDQLLKDNLSGKTFYDSFNIKYEVNEDGNTVKINGTEGTLNLADKTKILNSHSKVYKMSSDEYYILSSNDDQSQQIDLTTNKNDLYKGSFPPAVYSYINSDAKYIDSLVDQNLYNQNVISADPNARKKYDDLINKSLIDMLSLTDVEIKLRKDLELKSSQKVVSEKEVNFTTIEKQDPDDLISETKGYTEDYIFYADTGEVAPVGYLQFPVTVNDLKIGGFLPRYDYPSNHLAVVTEFIWIN